MDEVDVKEHSSYYVVVIGQSVFFCDEVYVIYCVNACENKPKPTTDQVEEMTLKHDTENSHHQTCDSHHKYNRSTKVKISFSTHGIKSQH